MSKIAIVSQPGQGVVIDVSGCASAEEAAYHLSSTLQVPNGFWNDMDLDLNFGNLDLDLDQTRRLLAVAGDAGVVPRQVFAANPKTKESLAALNIELDRPFESPPSAYTVAPEAVPLPSSSSEFVSTATAVLEHADPSTTTENLPKLPTSAKSAAGVLYLMQTLRSGQSVNHKGHLVIIGDVNPGAEVMADGDITVWGSLRGVAHAGVSGNANAEIRALRIEAIQLRIAQAIARAPDRSDVHAHTAHLGPETARMSGGVIRITSSSSAP
jgi:septum site-determining protein MinC